MKKRKGLMQLLMVCTFLIFMPVRCYAKEVRFSADIPEDFNEMIEVYLNGDPHPMYRGMDYKMTLNLPEEIYEVTILSSTNITNKYEFIAAEQLDVSKEDSLTIQVIDTAPDTEGAEYAFDNHYDEPVEEVPSVPQPQLYDFSDGKTYGTLNISCKNYTAINKAIFTLVGKQTYQIALDRAHWFQAEVRLPLGSYYESTSIEIELDPDAVANDIQFSWIHKDNPSFFGQYYKITKDEPQSIADLTIYMARESEIMEVNSNLLFAETLSNNLLEAKREHVKQELESAFPELTIEKETIATAEPVSEGSTDIRNVIYVIAALLAMITVLLLLILKLKRKK